jgi:phospholipid/cholesterol/gamma-HCH transport system substrate-binding protein
MTKTLRDNARWVAAIIGLVVIAAVVAGYILDRQRVVWPWEDVYAVAVELSSAQAVTPGQGQQVLVAGVPVGEVKRVHLRDGRALVKLELRRDELDAVHADATVLLRPRTPLNDMAVALDPGSRAAPKLPPNAVLPVSRAKPNVNPDEVLAALDVDTRRYVTVLLSTMGRGLRGNGRRLRRVLRATGPTLEDVAVVNGELAARDRQVRALVSHLGDLSGALARRDRELDSLIPQANATFGALASRDHDLDASLRDLPATLAAVRGALDASRPLAAELRPALRDLEPAIAKLRPALDAVDPLVRRERQSVARISRFAGVARPLVRDARVALGELDAQTPDLTRTFRTLQYLANELAFNPDGPEEGFLFWLAWFAHNGNSSLSAGDAHGAVWHGVLGVACSTARVQAPSVFALLTEEIPACPEETVR